jgi:hypothetical protein
MSQEHGEKIYIYIYEKGSMHEVSALNSSFDFALFTGTASHKIPPKTAWSVSQVRSELAIVI